MQLTGRISLTVCGMFLILLCFLLVIGKHHSNLLLSKFLQELLRIAWLTKMRKIIFSYLFKFFFFTIEADHDLQAPFHFLEENSSRKSDQWYSQLPRTLRNYWWYSVVVTDSLGEIKHMLVNGINAKSVFLSANKRSKGVMTGEGSIPGCSICDFFRFCQSFTSNFPFILLSLPLPFHFRLRLKTHVCKLVFSARAKQACLYSKCEECWRIRSSPW